MKTLREQIEGVIRDEPVTLFMKGTPEMVMCGNSYRALNALHAAGAPVTTVDVLPDPRTNHRGAHPGAIRIPPRLVVDERVRPSNSRRQATRVRQVRRVVWFWRNAVDRLALQLTQHHVDRELARHFPGGCAAHSVAHDEQARVSPERVRILVELAHSTRVGARADPQPHLRGCLSRTAPHERPVPGTCW